MTHRLRSSATNFPPTQSQLNYSFLIFRRDDPLSQFHSFVCHFTWWGNKKWHERVGFICTELLNKLSWKVPVAQVLKEIKRFSNPEQPGLSSLICLEVVCIWAQPTCHFLFPHHYSSAFPSNLSPPIGLSLSLIPFSQHSIGNPLVMCFFFTLGTSQLCPRTCNWLTSLIN